MPAGAAAVAAGAALRIERLRRVARPRAAASRLGRVTATHALTGDDMTLAEVWAVAVERRDDTSLSAQARERMQAARDGRRAGRARLERAHLRRQHRLRPLRLEADPRGSRPRSCSCGSCARTPAASAIRTRTRSCGPRCCCARTRSRRATPARAIETVELLLDCLNRGVLPRVPARGSVGASGDLAPLAHLALPLVGEGSAWHDGELLDGRRGAAQRRARAGAAGREGGAVADQRHAVHGGAGRARARARAAARARRRLCLRAVARGAAGLAQLVPAADPRAAPAEGARRQRRQRAPAARRLGDHRVAPLVRQGAGRLLAPLRAAGARRLHATSSTTSSTRSVSS